MWSNGSPTGYFIQAVLRMRSQGWRVEFWILGPNNYVRNWITDLHLNPSTNSWALYSIEIYPDIGSVYMLILSSNSGGRGVIFTERNYGNYLDSPGTMMESYDFNMLDFPIGYTVRFYNYWVDTTSGTKKPTLNRYTYGIMHEAIPNNDETIVTRGFPTA